jgi:hypothetical protein
MSNPMRRTAKTIATIWPILSKGDYGQITYGTTYTITCTYEQGSSRQYRDSMGTMYIPAGLYWYEDIGIFPKLNDKIALGDHLLVTDPLTVSGVEVIKNRLKQEDAIRGGTPDILVLT